MIFLVVVRGAVRETMTVIALHDSLDAILALRRQLDDDAEGVPMVGWREFLAAIGCPDQLQPGTLAQLVARSDGRDVPRFEGDCDGAKTLCRSLQHAWIRSQISQKVPSSDGVSEQTPRNPPLGLELAITAAAGAASCAASFLVTAASLLLLASRAPSSALLERLLSIESSV